MKQFVAHDAPSDMMRGGGFPHQTMRYQSQSQLSFSYEDRDLDSYLGGNRESALDSARNHLMDKKERKKLDKAKMDKNVQF